MHAILHDLRLTGFAPTADLNVTVSASNGLPATLARIRQAALAQSGPITLDILCHGYSSHSDHVNQRSTAEGLGGGGLQLCKENLLHTNVQKVQELFGVVSTITVYACGAANTAPGYEGSNRDGQRLFREMSTYSGATIYAADATQWYWNRRLNLPNQSASVIDFRGWDGTLYSFSPDGTVAVVESNATGTPR